MQTALISSSSSTSRQCPYTLGMLNWSAMTRPDWTVRLATATISQSVHALKSGNVTVADVAAGAD